MPLNPQIPFQALSTTRIPSPLAQLSTAGNVANQFRAQQQQEQLTDIFARNVQPTAEGGFELNKQSVLSDLYKTQPGTALKFEQAWAQTAPKRADVRKNLREDIALTSQILSGTADPMQASRALVKAGLDVSDMPSLGSPEWDAWKENKINMGVAAKDLFSIQERKLDRKRRDKQLDIMADKFGLDKKKFGLEKKKLAISEKELAMKEEKMGQAVRKNVEAHKAMKLKKSEQILELEAFADLAESIALDQNLKFVTGVGQLAAFVPGTAAADLDVDVDRLLSMGAIATMGKLKAESPTGSTGFGALSQKELSVIQNAFAGLGKKQSPAKMRKELTRIAQKMRAYVDNINRFEAEGEAIMRERGVLLEAPAPAAESAPIPTNEQIDNMSPEELQKYLNQ